MDILVVDNAVEVLLEAAVVVASLVVDVAVGTQSLRVGHPTAGLDLDHVGQRLLLLQLRVGSPQRNRRLSLRRFGCLRRYRIHGNFRRHGRSGARSY